MCMIGVTPCFFLGVTPIIPYFPPVGNSDQCYFYYLKRRKWTMNLVNWIELYFFFDGGQIWPRALNGIFFGGGLNFYWKTANSNQFTESWLLQPEIARGFLKTKILENIQILVHALHFKIVETLFKAEKIIFGFNLWNDRCYTQRSELPSFTVRS